MLFDKGVPPKKPGAFFIYSLFDKNNICIYVGQTDDLKGRIYYHISTGKEVDHFDFFECDASDANDLEAETMVKMQPLLNKNLPPNSSFCSTAHLKSYIGKFLDENVPVCFHAAKTKNGSKGLMYIETSLLDKIEAAIKSVTD